MKIEIDCDHYTGWLKKYKNCHCIQHLKAAGEKLFADHETAEKYVDYFDHLVTENKLIAKQICNADECCSDILHKIQLDRTHVVQAISDKLCPTICVSNI